jgi:hypothetical protein
MKYVRVHLLVDHQRAMDQILQQRFDNKYKKRAYFLRSFFNQREKKGAHSKGSLFLGHSTAQHRSFFRLLELAGEKHKKRRHNTPATLHKGI